MRIPNNIYILTIVDIFNYNVHCTTVVFYYVYSFIEIPPCGLVFSSTEGKLKEGDSVNITYLFKNINDFHWLDNSGHIINVDGRKFKQRKLANNDFVLTILNISEKQAGDYTVQCSSGVKTKPVHLDVLGRS